MVFKMIANPYRCWYLLLRNPEILSNPQIQINKTYKNKLKNVFYKLNYLKTNFSLEIYFSCCTTEIILCLSVLERMFKNFFFEFIL